MPQDKPLRIIHCFRSPLGGIFRHVRDLAREHSAAGHQVGIVCDSLTGSKFEDDLFDTIRPYLALGLTRIPIKRAISPSDMAALFSAYKTIKSLQPDILHGHGAKGGVLARTIGSLLRVQRYRVSRLYSPHGGSLHFCEGTLAGNLVFGIERLQSHMTDAITFVCDYEQQTYERKIGKPNTLTRRIYNGIDGREFAPVPLVDAPADFLYIGMLRDLKGPDLFIDAFCKAEDITGRRLSAYIIGDGPDRDKYAATLEQRQLTDRVTMSPAKPAREAFSLARTVVIPSRAESMPYIVIEALAAGKPIIASRVGGIPEVLGSQSPALVAPGDTDAFARLMADAANDPDWGSAFLPRPDALKQVFSSQAMAADLLRLYHELSS
ncbi:glycosyltransferase family 4 protein [Rhizobium sp. PAMB 3182]